MGHLWMILGIGLIFVIYEIAMYGVTNYILGRSASLRGDFWWCMALAIPFGIGEVLWLRGWRMGDKWGMTPWAVDVVYLAAAVIGSSIAMIVFFKQVPTTMQVVGLCLVLLGGLIAVWK